MASDLKSPLSQQVKRALKIPLPWTLKRIEALNYIAEYNQEQAYNPSILELARLDFNLLQLHLRELKDFSRWGNTLYSIVGLTYSRDRIVECYFWSYTVYYEQKYAEARIILAKIFVLTSLLDDTYDMHATLEEGQKLDEAWDENAISLLPEYLKNYYAKLISTFKDIEAELKSDEKYYVTNYALKAYQRLCKHYLQEAVWFHHNYIPSFQDHLDVSIISSGAPMLSVSLVGTGDLVTKEALEWATGCTDAVKACGEITRFLDDLAAFKNGKSKMDISSCVECHMVEHSVTGEVATAAIGNLVEDAWKTINQSRFEHPSLVPAVNRVANLAMSMVFLFQDSNDAYTFSELNKKTIQQQFLEPIPI
uniref:Terpene synthase metal-binding domain-containing protein n=1 Tax=Oryza brachyantha TaxID=4533 RepID=J3LNQ9_ORYBR